MCIMLSAKHRRPNRTGPTQRIRPVFRSKLEKGHHIDKRGGENMVVMFPATEEKGRFVLIFMG